MRNMLLPYLLLWLLSGCSAFDRWQIESKRRLAEAHLMEECRRTIQLGLQSSCSVAVTIQISHKTGEVPQFSLIPPLGALPLVGGILGGTR